MSDSDISQNSTLFWPIFYYWSILSSDDSLLPSSDIKINFKKWLIRNGTYSDHILLHVSTRCVNVSSVLEFIFSLKKMKIFIL